MTTGAPQAKDPSLKRSLSKGLKIGAVGAILMLAGIKLAPTQKPLTPDQEYAAGVQFKKRGRTELSREHLRKAIDSGDPEVSRRALVFLATQLPAKPISQEAEQRNAIGFNQLAKGDLPAATKTFTDLTRDFPEFEWPYYNLGNMALRQHKLEEARPFLEKAVALNPNYLKAWASLSKLNFLTGNDRQGQECLEHCRALQAGQIVTPKEP